MTTLIHQKKNLSNDETDNNEILSIQVTLKLWGNRETKNYSRIAFFHTTMIVLGSNYKLNFII